MESNWSGIEYSFASFLLENGRYKEAAQIVETVERRHTQNGRRFNHEEWGTLLSCAGILGKCYVFDWSKGRYAQRKARFRPPCLNSPPCRGLCRGDGKLSIAENKIRIECPSGSMKLKIAWDPHRNGKSGGDD